MATPPDGGERSVGQLVRAAEALLVLLLSACAVRWLRLDGNRFGVVVVTFLPWVLLPAYLLLGIGVGARRRVLILGAGCVVVFHLLWVSDDLTWRRADTSRAQGAPTVEVVAANVYFSNPDIDAAFDDLLNDGADILVLSEVNGAWWWRLQDHPIVDAYPNRHRVGDVAVLATTPLGDVGSVPDTFMPRVVVTVDGVDVTVVGVHAVPATSTGRWAEQLSALERFAASRTGPLIMAGDFNATTQHRQFRAILRQGLVDAHRQRGTGWGATWPTDFPLGPLLRLDHVLASDADLVVIDADRRDTPGSDHARVVAEIAVLGSATAVDPSSGADR